MRGSTPTPLTPWACLTTLWTQLHRSDPEARKPLDLLALCGSRRMARALLLPQASCLSTHKEVDHEARAHPRGHPVRGVPACISERVHFPGSRCIHALCLGHPISLVEDRAGPQLQ